MFFYDFLLVFVFFVDCVKFLLAVYVFVIICSRSLLSILRFLDFVFACFVVIFVYSLHFVVVFMIFT